MSAFDTKILDDPWLSADWNRLPELTAAHKIVSTDSGADYYADGVADEVQIQAAIDALSAGRTWYETVVCKGQFKVDSQIELASYTRLLILGEIQAGSRSFADNQVILSDDSHHVDIIGGSVSVGSSGAGYPILISGPIAAPYKCRVLGVKADLTIDLRLAYQCEVAGCHITDNGGIGLSYASYRNHVHHNWIEDCATGHAINVSGGAGAGYENIIDHNYIRKMDTGLGITIDQTSYRNVVTGNIVIDTEGDGINCEDGCNDNIIANNVLYDCRIASSGTANYRNKIIGNTLIGASHINAGILLSNANNCEIVGNTVHEMGYGGIQLSDSDYNVVTGNVCINNGQTTGWGGIVLNQTSSYNTVHNNICLDDQGGGATQDYGLREYDTADYNSFFHNILTGNKTGCYINDGTGTHSKFPSVVAPFVNGTLWDDRGWDIDAAAEYAGTFLTLPNDFQELVELRVWAYSVVLEADAMRVELAANAGGSNEAYDTEAISVVDKSSATTNFAADDVIYWSFTASDDADLGHLAAGDSIDIKILHEVAGGDDCETDARFRYVELKYV